MLYHINKPMRLRFTIRDLLWLTAVVAVCIAWWLNNRSLRRQFLVESVAD